MRTRGQRTISRRCNLVDVFAGRNPPRRSPISRNCAEDIEAACWHIKELWPNVRIDRFKASGSTYTRIFVVPRAFVSKVPEDAGVAEMSCQMTSKKLVNFSRKL